MSAAETIKELDFLLSEAIAYRLPTERVTELRARLAAAYVEAEKERMRR